MELTGRSSRNNLADNGSPRDNDDNKGEGNENDSPPGLASMSGEATGDGDDDDDNRRRRKSVRMRRLFDVERKTHQHHGWNTNLANSLISTNSDDPIDYYAPDPRFDDDDDSDNDDVERFLREQGVNGDIEDNGSNVDMAYIFDHMTVKDIKSAGVIESLGRVVPKQQTTKTMLATIRDTEDPRQSESPFVKPDSVFEELEQIAATVEDAKANRLNSSSLQLNSDSSSAIDTSGVSSTTKAVSVQEESTMTGVRGSGNASDDDSDSASISDSESEPDQDDDHLEDSTKDRVDEEATTLTKTSSGTWKRNPIQRIRHRIGSKGKESSKAAASDDEPKPLKRTGGFGSRFLKKKVIGGNTRVSQTVSSPGETRRPLAASVVDLELPPDYYDDDDHDATDMNAHSDRSGDGDKRAKLSKVDWNFSVLNLGQPKQGAANNDDSSVDSDSS